MSKHIRSLAAFLFILLFSALGAQANYSLNDIKKFKKRELSQIKHRYDEYKANKQLFSNDQFETIFANDLTPIIAAIIIHEHIELTTTGELIDFAQIAKDSTFDFGVLEPRIVRYIKNKEKIFEALYKAIQREERHKWKQERIESAIRRSGPFVQSIIASNVSREDKDKVLDIYAICIDSYRFKEEREALTPTVCKPIEGFKRPRYKKHPVAENDMDTVEDLDRAYAYHLLMSEARTVADDEGLDDFERIVMSNCIAENALRFIKASDDPIKAVCKSITRPHQSPDEEFFENTGVCSNFSGIAFNAARELGLEGRVYLARKRLHIYIEFKSQGEWYHTHPFSGLRTCSAFKFGKVEFN